MKNTKNKLAKICALLMAICFICAMTASLTSSASDGDIVLPDAVSEYPYEFIVTDSLSETATYEITDGIFPVGMELRVSGNSPNVLRLIDASSIGSSPIDVGTFRFEITIVDDGVSSSQWYQLTVNEKPAPNQDAYFISESFENGADDWDTSEGWTVVEDANAPDGGFVIKSTAENSLITPQFKASPFDVEMIWYDCGVAGEEYSVYARRPRDVPADDGSEWYEVHLGDFTATGEWTVRSVKWQNTTSESGWENIVFKHSGTQELMFDMIMITRGHDQRDVEEAYVGFEYSEYFGTQWGDIEDAYCTVTAGELPPGLSIESTIYEQHGYLHKQYELCGVPTQPGSYAFSISSGDGTTYNSGWDRNIFIVVYDTPETTPGDINGDSLVNTADAAMILRSTVDLVKISDLQKTLADFNADGKVDTADAAGVLRYCVGLDN